MMAPRPPADLVELGRIAGAYGVHGWIKVRLHGRVDESVLCSAQEAWIRLPSQEASQPEPGSSWQRVGLRQARPHAETLLLRMDVCDSREQAERYKGCAIAVSRSSFPDSAPDEYYWVDLLGCEVIGQEGAILGRVLAIEDFGAPHPVLRVASADGRLLLIPFVAPIIDDVDLAAGRITADWAADY